MLRGIHSSPREGFKAGGAGDEESGKGVQRQLYLKEFVKYLSFLTLRLHPSCDTIRRCENVLV